MPLSLSFDISSSVLILQFTRIVPFACCCRVLSAAIRFASNLKFKIRPGSERLDSKKCFLFILASAHKYTHVIRFSLAVVRFSLCLVRWPLCIDATPRISSKYKFCINTASKRTTFPGSSHGAHTVRARACLVRRAHEVKHRPMLLSYSYGLVLDWQPLRGRTADEKLTLLKREWCSRAEETMEYGY